MTANVAQQEYSNNKCYALAYIYIKAQFTPLYSIKGGKLQQKIIGR